MKNPWPVMQLEEVLTKSEEWIEIQPDEKYRQVTVRLWGEGVVLRNEVSGIDISAKRRLVVRPGQFILSRIDARNGAFGLIPDSLNGAIVSNDFPTFNIDCERLHPRFMQWMSKTKDFVDLCRAASEGTTNRVRLKVDRFLATGISLPPLDEQRRIVVRIEELASLIKEARALRVKAREEAEALLASALRETFLSLAQDPNCERTELGRVAHLQRGRFSHRPRNDPRFFGGDHPWIQIGEIESAGKYITDYTETLNEEGLAISRKFPKGTLLISIAATIGALGILSFDCCVPDSIVAVMPDETKATSEFLYYFLAYARSHLEEIAPQSAQKNINLRILQPLPIFPPLLDEQHRIVAYLDDLQAQVDELTAIQDATQAELEALLPSVLDRAFRGEL